MLLCIVRPHHPKGHVASPPDHKVMNDNLPFLLFTQKCFCLAAHTPRRSPLPPEPSPITPIGDNHPIKQQG